MTANGLVFTTDDNGKVSVDNKIITLIPYYAWCHRGPGKMIVWMASGLEVMDEHR